MDAPEFVRVEFPATKEDIERYVNNSFVPAAVHHGFFPFQPLGPAKQNATDDFDFSLPTSIGPKYIELTEIYLRDIVKVGAQASYSVVAAAEHTEAAIQKKSAHYGSATSQGIILLLYATHWQFDLTPAVFYLVAFGLLRNRPVFEQVFYMSFLDQNTVNLSMLYPLPADAFATFDRATYRDSRVILLNPERYRLDSE
jgi:hypothetical protein